MRPEDEVTWHRLRVDYLGEFVVRASDLGAAWLKLSYWCQETSGGSSVQGDYRAKADLQWQFPIFQHEAVVSKEESDLLQSVHGNSSVINREAYASNLMPAARYPDHAEAILAHENKRTETQPCTSLADVVNVVRLAA